jgi:ActR/RegA family two-component response regulator
MKTSPVRLALSWALVVVLLGYGVIQTAITAAKLFQ